MTRGGPVGRLVVVVRDVKQGGFLLVSLSLSLFFFFRAENAPTIEAIMAIAANYTAHS